MQQLVVMVVCLLSNPDECKSIGLPMYNEFSSSSPHSCYYIAQFKMAEWLSSHEGWQLKKFSCDTNTVFGDRI